MYKECFQRVIEKIVEQEGEKQMTPNDKIQLFEDKRIRTAWDEEKEEWYFSIVDAVAVLTDSSTLKPIGVF